MTIEEIQSGLERIQQMPIDFDAVVELGTLFIIAGPRMLRLPLFIRLATGPLGEYITVMPPADVLRYEISLLRIKQSKSKEDL